MASINQFVSELAHSLKQPNNAALKENLKLIIIHTRNEIIRHSYEKHGYVDKIMNQRFKVSLCDVNDGDIILPESVDYDNITKIKRTIQKVPRPVRLTNNLPFARVSSTGYKTNREFPYIKETSARFRDSLPGMCGMPCYDYINEYLYIFPTNKAFDLNSIVIEAAFEHPNEIAIKNGENSMDIFMDNNEWLLSEDMIGQIKDIIYKRDFLQNVRETNEVPNVIKYNT